MRGNPHPTHPPAHPPGSIPAYAGEPTWTYRPRRMCPVYPRVCGGTLQGIRAGGGSSGLSPRMRGNPVLAHSGPEQAGSIPAYAGEPRAAVSWRPGSPVYPRVCGGTWLCRHSCQTGGGLSPRMRGNLFLAQLARSPAGSIPAYAGEPITITMAGTRGTVYPRVCGGTVFVSEMA